MDEQSDSEQMKNLIRKYPELAEVCAADSGVDELRHEGIADGSSADEANHAQGSPSSFDENEERRNIERFRSVLKAMQDDLDSEKAEA